MEIFGKQDMLIFLFIGIPWGVRVEGLRPQGPPRGLGDVWIEACRLCLSRRPPLATRIYGYPCPM